MDEGTNDEVQEFPAEQLVALEGTISPQHFDINVNPSGPLSQCLDAAIALLLKDGIKDTGIRNSHCLSFMSKMLPLCYDKLLRNQACFKWDDTILNKIKNLALKAIQLAALSVELDINGPMTVVAYAWDPDSNFHEHNAGKPPLLACDYASEPKASNAMTAYSMGQKGFLSDMINHFGAASGFSAMRRRLQRPDGLNLEVLGALIRPFGQCIDWFSNRVFQEAVLPLADVSFRYVESLSGKKLHLETKHIEKNNRLRWIVHALREIRSRAAVSSSAQNKEVGGLFLDTLLRIIKGDSFNGVMYALNELKKIINDVSPWLHGSPNSNQKDPVDPWITIDDLQNWMFKNDLLGILFRDNLHHAQYVARLEEVVKFLMTSGALTTDHLSEIWNAQTGKHEVIVNNIHDLLARLACHFDTLQLDHLLVCFRNSWGGTVKQMERMLEFIRRLAEDDKEGNVAPKVLQLLWNVAHSADAPSEIIDAARSSHVQILTYSYMSDKSVQRRFWVTACLRDIEKNVYVVHTMRHMEHIIAELAYDDHGETGSSRSTMLQQLDVSINVRSMIVNNICKYMIEARKVIAENSDGIIAGVTHVEQHHTHEESLGGRLQFLKFFLKHAMLQLEPVDTLRIWSALVENPSCLMDKELCYEWCTLMEVSVLSAASVNALFLEKLLTSRDPGQFTIKLFSCFRSIFYAVNEQQGRLIREGHRISTANLELQGREILFAVALQCTDADVYAQASELVIRIHTLITEDLRESAVSLHNGFIRDTVSRIKEARVALDDTPPSMVEARSSELMIERSLSLLIKYVAEWDMMYFRRRLFLSHGLAFQGDKITVQVSFPKTTSPVMSIHTCANETLQGLRDRLARTFQMSPASLQLQLDDQDLEAGHRTMTLRQIGIKNGTTLYARNIGERVDDLTTLQPSDADEESKLPSLVVAQNEEVIEQLFDLAGGASSTAIRSKAMELLQLLPTIVMKLDSLKAALLAGLKSSTDALDALFGEDRAFQLLYNVQMICSLILPIQPLDKSVEYSAGFNNIRGSRYLLRCIKEILTRIPSATEADVAHYRDILRLCLRLLSHSLTFPDSQARDHDATAALSEWTQRGKEQLGSDDKLLDVPISLTTLISLASMAQIPSGMETDAQVTHEDQMLAIEAIHVLKIVLNLSGELCDVFLQQEVGRLLVREILLGCEEPIIRVQLCNLFKQLANQHAPALWDIGKALLGARGALEQRARTCDHFFELLCNIIKNHGGKLLTVEQRHEHLEAELEWLVEYFTTGVRAAPESEDCLLTGHLKLCTQLLCGCDPGHKHLVRQKLLDGAMRKILFPASYLLATARENNQLLPLDKTCNEFPNRFARIAAYRLIIELSTSSVENFKIVSDELNRLHMAEEPKPVFDYEPDINKRGVSGYVGLKNAGATCYMNSVLQQIFMQPEIRCRILASPVVPESDQNNSALHQVQSMFAHLEKSNQQFYAPVGFWKAYRHFGEPVNIREQQDAHDFFLGLSDQLDELLKVQIGSKVLESVFGGSFADQKKIKSGCNHRYEREEPFMTLQVDVKDCASLEESLEQYIKGDLLEGANAYKCEQCGVKRDTIKRMCLKRMPKALVIHQKRFEFDWERDIPVKYNGFFEFPMQLDMVSTYILLPLRPLGRTERTTKRLTQGPYTVDGVDIRESTADNTGSAVEMPVCNFSLVGVVVHSGQANGGHYYSFVRERNAGGQLLEDSRWLRFDDAEVTEVDIDQEAMQKEFFGGTYTSDCWDSTLRRMVHRQKERWWNGYMLFYEKTTPPSDVASCRPSVDIPLPIQLSTHEQNIRLLFQREVYNIDHFSFVLKLCLCNEKQLMMIDQQPDNEALQQCGRLTLDLFLQFTLKYGFRTDARIRGQLADWVKVAEALVHGSVVCATSLLQQLAKVDLNQQFLLMCPNAEVREVFKSIVLTTLDSFYRHDHSVDHALRKAESYFTTCLIPILEKDLYSYWKNVDEIFAMLCTFAWNGHQHRAMLYDLGLVNLAMGLWISSSSWAKYQVPPCISLYQFVCSMIRVLAFPKDVSAPAGPQNSYDPKENPENDFGRYKPEFAVAQAPILYANMDLIQKIHKSGHLVPSLHQAPACDELHRAIRFLCYQEKDLYSYVVNEVIKALYYCHPPDTQYYYTLLRKFFENEDDNQEVNMKLLWAIFIEKGPSQHRYVLFDLMEHKYVDRTINALKYMVELADRYPHVKSHVSGAARDKWSWTIRLVNNLVQRHHYPAAANNPMVVLLTKLDQLSGGVIGHHEDDEGPESDDDDSQFDTDETMAGVVPSG